ncbi:Zn-dependent protease with chaperone function [Thalassotalea agarivorans]|uniref:Zn-dependent protease with chaperone function n=2 Tax=Thalassotalea agarivorans TaxID=349064 RepID=A0A1I0HBY9_THASX|nr:Zn-dependent protease with chaperone function [Thalassotalea agarivorans]
MTNILVMVLFGYANLEQNELLSVEDVLAQFDWGTFFLIGAVVTGVVLLGSFYKTLQLGHGGKAIAEGLGGRLVSRSTRDEKERVLLNVVDEMAIASGCPVPCVYIMDHEIGINAFAAGYKHSDAVIGVTRGCIETLSRDELQGVIAHEFSHILNGDMRLNMRLIGILHGIMVMGYIGYYLLRTGGASRKNGGALIGLGLGLIVIGFGGAFFGNWIKATVSRQREYLADASAVQFTRAKDGIAGALYKISKGSSHLDSATAPQMSHAFFSEGVSSFAGGMFATHPPLNDRIKRISPYFITEQKVKKQQKKRDQATQMPEQGHKQTIAKATIASTLIGSIGNISDKQIHHAQTLLASIPRGIEQARYHVGSAKAVIYAFVLDEDEQVQTRQLKYLESKFEDVDAVANFAKELKTIPIEYRLAVIDMIIPTLKEMSLDAYQLFKQHFNFLIHADHKISNFEWVLQQILLKHLKAQYSTRNNKLDLSVSIDQRGHHLNVLFSMLVRYQTNDEQQQQHFLTEAQKVLGSGALTLLSEKAIEDAKSSQLLLALEDLSLEDKPKLLNACLLILASDDVIDIKDIEFLRGLSDLLDCPMPPHK